MRMQAVVALAALQDADEDIEDEDEDEPTLRVADVLLDVLCHDPAAYDRFSWSDELVLTDHGMYSEVRRAALFNIVPSRASIDGLLTRTRDIDTINRKGSFSHVLIEVPPSQFTLEQRVALMDGLKDREEGVVKAARKLCGVWLDKAGGLEPVRRPLPRSISC